MKWKVAALTLATWPIALWLAPPDPSSRGTKILLVFASLPLFIALGIELYAQWRQLYERPESYVAGSPTGNKIAVVLAVLLIGLVACLAYSIVRQHT
jgi:putative effector of murein hydrolase